MKLLIVAVLLISLISCSTKIYPVKGTYTSPPVTFTSPNSFDVVWDKMVDMFAQKGFAIKIIDRSSGLIISNGKMPVTVEGKDGSLEIKDAFVVVPSMKMIGGGVAVQGKYVASTGWHYDNIKKKNIVVNNPIIGEWNVRIKSNGVGCTININIVNTFTEDVTTYDGKFFRGHSVDVQSTGYFENYIFEKIK